MTVEMQFATPADLLGAPQTRLVDVVDSLLGHGVVLRGELWISVAEVDLVLAEPGKMRELRG